jgi:hypothetical protein
MYGRFKIQVQVKKSVQRKFAKYIGTLGLAVVLKFNFFVLKQKEKNISLLFKSTKNLMSCKSIGLNLTKNCLFRRLAP